ncbi:atrial natriuretic peptide receptor 2-like, partial [Scleropages formosus]
VFLISTCAGWHDLDNSEYDCWPIEKPDEYNMIECGGLEMAWVHRPPEKVVSGVEFGVTYSVTASDAFYQWAVDNVIFTQSYIRDAAAAKRFCEEYECPSNWKDANGENCCIHHANIHSCPMGYMVEERICGPWIPDDGRIFTHTISTAGKMTQTNWTAKVVLFHVGVTSLIAHIRVGRMQVALEAKSTVFPAIVCGDGLCEEEEMCSTCPADCGECPMTPAIKVAIGLPIALFFMSFLFTAVWFQYQKQKMLWDESWVIDFGQIKQDQVIRTTTGSIVSVPNGNSNSNASCMTALSSCTGAFTSSRKQTFTHTGFYDGRTVAIKKINTKTFSLSKTIRREVKQVRFSFAMDIARGMAYLHQHRICHGRLKSGNCVIDDRWVCKITDYCLPTYRREDSEVVLTTYQQRLREVYLPPEAQTSSMEPTLPGDVFSYSIILLETATRSDPVPVEDTSMGYAWCPPLPELISGKAENTCPCPSDYAELIRRCRAHNPAHRPTFEQIKKFVHRINPNKVSPVDMMMNLMEKYSKHLEVLVAERTQDLMHEKQKTDRLLYSMLPKQVADDLRQGKPAQAQSYVSTTVFFSDIVGFTQLSSTSTPYQVVEFLNKLYTTFDEIIDNYDVYKVETIGDAYMVVSGVPKVNGILHASEIASMALDLVGVCRTFSIPHKPDSQLQIRAGIHSGPVVAGVVGTKMPRYCLFGDTVNTASRMESTSEALKIQCSSSTFYLLEEIGGYVLCCRGVLQVKGKGDMVTYWLEGKQARLEGQGQERKSLHIPGAGKEHNASIPGHLDNSLLIDPE